jgi:hypothetical protein
LPIVTGRRGQLRWHRPSQPLGTNVWDRVRTAIKS